MARQCCDYHRHVDSNEPFVPGVDVTWCGYDAGMKDWERLGLSAGQVISLPLPPDPPCPDCGLVYCECDEYPQGEEG